MRWTSFLVAGLLLAACRPAVEEPAPAEPTTAPRPTTPLPGVARNVLFIVVDTLRADALSLYGAPHPTSPSLDAFAREAVTFDWAISPSSWTRASIASYFTGLHPSAHGCEGRDGMLAPGHETLAERFAAAGFATAGIYANGNIDADFGFAQGFALWEHPPATVGYPGDKLTTDAAEMNRRLLSWLEHERPTTPWFLFALYVDPHDPYLPHPEHRFVAPAARSIEGRKAALKSLTKAAPGAETDAARQQIRELYDQEVAYLDRHLGELFAALRRSGRFEDTTIVITADHGEAFWEHGNDQGHGKWIWQNQIHVPLIVRWPGRSGPGRHVTTPVESRGLPQALLAGFGIDNPPEPPPLLAALTGEIHPGAVFSETTLDGFVWRALIDWPLKAIRDDRQQRWQLFDLVADPGELRPLDDAEALGRLVAGAERIAAANARRRRETPAATLPKVDRETRERLKALGYIQ